MHYIQNELNICVQMIETTFIVKYRTAFVKNKEVLPSTHDQY